MLKISILAAAGALLASRAAAHDTTLAYAGGRVSGTFVLDGRASSFTATRPDAPDTVRFANGLILSRVMNRGGMCILGCTYEVPTVLSFHAAAGTGGFAGGADTSRSWDSALAFPAQLKPLDSIPSFLSPCGGGGPYGLGFTVSTDYREPAFPGGGCADRSTFGARSGHDRVYYFRNQGVSLKLQVLRIESRKVNCDPPAPPYYCSTEADKIVFRYSITDSAGIFAPGPASLFSRERPRLPQAQSREPWKSEVYRTVQGRTVK